VKYPYPLYLAIPCLLAAPTPASGQLPEILVTAEFRDTALLESSNSVSVLGADAIRRRSAQHLEELLNMAPNVNFAGGSSRARYFQIRGIGDRGQFREPLNPSVGVLIDGVDFSGIGTASTLFDVAQVEVLRGPQGTLHGANALAGLINVRSNEPGEEFHHRIEAGVGNYGAFSLGAVSGGPLSERLLYRVAVRRYTGDGFQENEFLGADDTNDRDELTLRGRLRWLVGAGHTVDMTLNRVDIDNGYDAFSLDNDRRTRSDEPGRDTQRSLALGLTNDLERDAFRFRSGFSYAATQVDYGYDEDWTYVGFHPDGYSSFDLYERERDSVSAEFRFLSTDVSTLFGGRTDWVAGIYYLANDEDLDRTYTYAPDFTSEYDTETRALFGELNTRLGDRWTLVTGLRFENRDTDYTDNNGVAFDTDKDLRGGRVALEYAWDEDGMAYAAVSRGYRGNGVNADILANLETADEPDLIAALARVGTFDEETLLNYELGLKRSLLDNTLRLRAALFYMDRDDLQVKGSFLVPRDSGATTFVDYTSNAATGENFGAEFELDWLVGDALQLWASVGLLDTEFGDYVNATGEDLSGRAQAHAPEYQYAVGGRYRFPAGLYLRLEVEGRDEFYFSESHGERSEAYDLINAGFGYEGERWSWLLWGRNLADEDYYVRGFSFGNDPRKGYATEPYYQFGEPRTVGVTASRTF